MEPLSTLSADTKHPGCRNCGECRCGERADSKEDIPVDVAAVAAAPDLSLTEEML